MNLRVLGRHVVAVGASPPRWLRSLGLWLAMALAPAGPVVAQTSWAGAYAGVGLAVGETMFDLDTLSATAGGRPLDLGSGLSDSGFLLLGYRGDLGPFVLGAEAEVQHGRSFGPRGGCVLGAICADAGIIGDYGPIFRFRVMAGYEFAPDMLLNGGVGLGLASVSSSHVFATSSTAQGGSAAITKARSPFVVDDMAHGLTLLVGVEHRLTERASVRFDLVHDRLRVSSSNGAFIYTQNTTADVVSVAQIAERGDFFLNTTTARLSLVFRF